MISNRWSPTRQTATLHLLGGDSWTKVALATAGLSVTGDCPVRGLIQLWVKYSYVLHCKTTLASHARRFTAGKECLVKIDMVPWAAAIQNMMSQQISWGRNTPNVSPAGLKLPADVELDRYSHCQSYSIFAICSTIWVWCETKGWEPEWPNPQTLDWSLLVWKYS